MTCPLKIREIRVRAVKVPLDPPHKTASGSITESPLVLTDIRTEEGVEGLEPLLIGRDVAPLDIERRLARHFALLGPQGLNGIAMAAIDMALWDTLAKGL